jgi:hypothetical protein
VPDGRRDTDTTGVTTVRLRVFLVGLLATTLALPAGAAAAHPPGPPQPPAPGGPTTVGFEQLANVNPGAGSNGDVYAYRGMAFLGSWVGKGCLSKGVRVYGLHNPRHPRHLSTFADAASDPSLAGTWTEKVIVQRVNTRAFHGDLAVVTFQVCDRKNTAAFRGFGLYDVTHPTRPKKLALYAAPNTRGSHEIWLGASHGRAYVYTAIINSELTTSPDYDPVTNTATTPGRADFRIVDVSRPTRPRDVGEWGAWRQLGIAPTAEKKANFVHSVRVDDRLRRAYLSYWDLGTVILDIRNPARPRYLGRTTPDKGAAHSTDVARGGRLLVETQETEAGLPRFYDISNPARPRLLSTFSIEGFENDTVHDPKVRDHVTYFSWYSHGVVAADIADPRRPRKIAQFVPDSDYINPDFFCEEPCAQVWGVALDRGYVLASDMNSGLYVLTRR